MTTTPDFSKLHMSDLLDFCRIIDALRDVKNPVTTYKAVEIRLKVDKRGEPIRNVSDRLQKLSEKLYGKQPNRLTAATRGAGEVRILGEGQRLYRFAISVLKTMQWFRNETAADIDRRLTIHSASAFAAHILPVLLRGYLKRSYFREIWLYEHTQVADILHAVACGQGDIGICIDWPDPGLNKTELLRARRGILLGGAYLGERKLTSRDSLASEVLITYQPNTLRRLKIQDAFPEPDDAGVRVYAETENVIYGWITNNAAIGHAYVGGVQQPSGTRFILTSLMEQVQDVCWCAYTSFHPREKLDENRDQELAKVVEAMRNAAQTNGRLA